MSKGTAKPRRFAEVVEAFDMVGQAGLFTDGLMLFVWNDSLIRPPEIAVDDPLAVVCGYGVPQPPTGCFTTPADDTSHNLARLPCIKPTRPGADCLCDPQTTTAHRAPTQPAQVQRVQVRCLVTRAASRLFLSHPKRHPPRRSVVEVSHSWFNRFRCLLARWEKLAQHYLAFAQLAACLNYLPQAPLTTFRIGS